MNQRAAERMSLAGSSPQIPVAGFGPRTDVRYMTRAELFRSAWQFLLAALVMSVTCVAVAYFGSVANHSGDPTPLIQGLFFLFWVLAGMGFAGSLYLAIRGVIRSPSYDPLSIWLADARSSIELHDSVLKSIEMQGAVLVLWMDAYVHRSIGVPGVDAGMGWIYVVALRFNSGRCAPALPEPLARICDGILHLGADHLENAIPVPLDFKGSVRLDLVISNDAKLSIEGDGLRVALTGEGRYVEGFPSPRKRAS
jgi:hypothetical protein